MQHISVKELVGENAITLDDGEAIFSQIHDALISGEMVELDFEGVKIFASPFFNAGIGRLLADVHPDNLNTCLKFQRMSALGDRLLRRVIENAKEYYSANQGQREAIDHIVHETVVSM